MNVLAYDLYPDHNFAREEQIVYTSLDELYHNSGYHLFALPAHRSDQVSD